MTGSHWLPFSFHLGCGDKQIPQLMELVADLRGFFEFQILSVLHHLPFQFVNFLLQSFWCQHDGIFLNH